jgi:hypothetical protein
LESLTAHSEKSVAKLDSVTRTALASNLPDPAYESEMKEYQDKDKSRTNSELTSNYAAYTDVGERAFVMLLDLGIIQKTPDVDDPLYDHYQDDALAPENNFEIKKIKPRRAEFNSF